MPGYCAISGCRPWVPDWMRSLATHRTKWRGEEIVRGSGLAWTIFRPSLIFGPRDAFVNMLAGNLRLAPVMPTMGDGNYRLQARSTATMWPCFADALERGNIGQVYELCGEDRLTYRELLDAPLRRRWARGIPGNRLRKASPCPSGFPCIPLQNARFSSAVRPG